MKKIISTLTSLIYFVSYSQTPSIISYSPAKGPVGTLVTVIGNNLLNPSVFTIGGANAIVISNNSDTLIGIVMPGAVTDNISITTSGGTASSTTNFMITSTFYPDIQQGNKLIGTGYTGWPINQGNSVAISADGNTALIGGPNDGNISGAGLGAVWAYTRSGTTWIQQGNKLVGTGGYRNTTFGRAVALSANGNTAIIGGNGDSTGSTNVGAIWFYDRVGGQWIQQGNKVLATGYTGSSNFGGTISISADGNTAIIGGPSDNNGIGAVWFFNRSGGVWTQQGNKHVGTGAVGNAWQGHSVAISADGSTAIVGGWEDNSYVGATWIYTCSGGVWTQQGNKLVGTGFAGGIPWQGSAVALSADGNLAVVGGNNDNLGPGATWIFTRSGGVWSQLGSKLIGTSSSNGAQQGQSVAVSADGNTLVVGGNLYDGNGIYAEGALWVFTRSGGVWNQKTKLIGTGQTLFSGHGASVGTAIALTPDGSTLIAGGISDNNTIGATWIFVDSSNISGIHNTASNIKLTISPNPTSGNLYIEGLDSKSIEFEIYNFFGEKVYYSLVPIFRSVIDISILPEGVYFINFKTREGALTRKLIVQR